MAAPVSRSSCVSTWTTSISQHSLPACGSTWRNPSASPGGAILLSNDTTWDETALTWATRPAVDGPVVATFDIGDESAWIEVDVSAALTGARRVTLVITSDRSDGVGFAARESDNPPELVLSSLASSATQLTPVSVQGGTLRSTATPGAQSTVTTGPTASAIVPPEPIAMPGRVEAEDYRVGGEGVGYHDTSGGNNGGVYRQDDVDIETCTDAASSGPCYNVGYIRAGEWLAYDLEFSTAADFAVTLRVASWHSERALHLEFDGNDISGPLVIPNTGYAQSWTNLTTAPLAFPAGVVTLRIVADDEGFNLNSFELHEPVADVVLVGAGDIGECNSDGDEQTASLLDNIAGTIFTTGDNAYPDGSPENFANCFEPSWGRHKERIRPSVGNHEYVDPSAQGYFGYFGAAAGEAGQGYYSYDLGAWHVVVLNSNCSRAGAQAGCDPDDPQVAWLRADLAAHPNTCTVAYWHHPRWSSGEYGDDENMATFWDALYDAGATWYSTVTNTTTSASPRSPRTARRMITRHPRDHRRDRRRRIQRRDHATRIQ